MKKISDNLRDELKERVESWAKQLNVKPSQIRVQRMSRKWASCSTAGWLTFAEDLLDQSLLFQNYVIVHELLHLRLPNHGKLFRSLLTVYVPGWTEIVPNSNPISHSLAYIERSSSKGTLSSKESRSS